MTFIPSAACRNVIVASAKVALVFIAGIVLPTCVSVADDTAKTSAQTRVARDRMELRHWLENMVWHHQFSREEVLNVTGLSPVALDEALRDFNISPNNRPQHEVDPPIFVLPYPGGRHPRIGFLDGALEPQRETKLSVFAPWDRSSYIVIDVPEAIWSNLGLTYLAHTHIDTIWSKQQIKLPQLEWQFESDGSYRIARELPNKIAFEVTATPHCDHLALRMSLSNGTAEKLTDLRVQMCGMLRGLKGFDQQTNDNKIFRGSLAACRNEAGDRWVIFGWEPNDRTWANAPCPCLHSDPRIPDCAPGETRQVDGWLSFYQGTDIDSELERIEGLWSPMDEVTVTGTVHDADSGQPIACRLYVQSADENWYFAEPASESGKVIRYEKQNWLNAKSQEFHSSLSADPFALRLPPGEYTLRVERGKEYFPYEKKIHVGSEPVQLEIALQRWTNMAELDWYSGDAHVHRPIRQLAIPMLADDVNVALPMVYWTTRSDLTAASGDRTDRDDAQLPASVIHVDSTHAIWPKNTEWEIFSVGGVPHTLGALFAINHQTPFDVAIPPTRAVLEQATRENALLDMDKHDWPFAMLLPTMLGNSLTYELANNHMWRTEFAFSKWNTPAPAWMNAGDGVSGGEREWIEFTHRTYWTLLNAGYRLQPTAGTATGVHPVPIGYGRVYVHVPGGFHYERWIEGLRQGNSFVTTGPMLLVEVADGRIQGRVLADGAVESIELIRNGQITAIDTFQTATRPDSSIELTFESELKRDTTEWIAVRVWQKSSTGRLRFAHSAPKWIDVPGKPLLPSSQEKQFLLERMRVERERSGGVLPSAALAEYLEAIETLEAMETR